MKKYIFLLIIFLSALFLRIYKLGAMPPGMNWDEAGLGYTAYSLLKTGNDEWGAKLPLFTKQFGEYKSAIYPYFTALSVKIFDLNEFSTRLPSALAGSFSILILYFLVNNLFSFSSFGKNKEIIALLASFILTINPWHLHFSRYALSANLALTFFLAGLTFLFSFLKNQRNLNLFLSIIFAALSVYTYHSFRIVLPLLYLFIFIENFKKFINKRIVVFILLIIVLVLPILNSYKKGYLTARAGKVTLTSSEEYQNKNTRLLKENVKMRIRGISFFNNPGLLFIDQALRNELAHFSSEFLFLGEVNNLRFGTGWYGKFYYLEVILMMVGLISLFRIKDKRQWFLVIWLIVAPVPAALSNESPHPIRAYCLLPVLVILIALGIFQLIPKEVKKISLRSILLFITGFIYLISFILYLNFYYIHFSQRAEYDWQALYKPPIKYLSENINSTDYKTIYFSNYYGQPHVFLFFYQRTNPLRVQNALANGKTNSILNSAIDNFENYRFELNVWDHKEEKDVLIIDHLLHEDNYPHGVKRLASYYFLNGDHAFSTYETTRSK